MKTIFHGVLVLVMLHSYNADGVAQTDGIKSGTIYMIRSKSNNKLLNTGNSSIENNANINDNILRYYYNDKKTRFY